MITRVTESMKYALMTDNLNGVQHKYNTLIERLSSQKRINRPSDDPLGTSSVMNYRDSLSSMEQYKKNIDKGISWLNITESTLSSAYDILVTIQGIAVSQSSDTATASTREQSAFAIQPLIDQLLSLADTKLGNQYIFSGTMTDTKPFEASSGSFTGGTVKVSESNTYTGVLASSGTYTGETNATYALRIVDGGDLDTATYQMSADSGKSWSATSSAGDLSSGTVSLGEGIELSFESGTFAGGDLFSVNAFVTGRFRGNGDELLLTVGKGHVIGYSISGDAAFTDKGEGTVDVFKTLFDLKSALEANDPDGIRSQIDNLKAAQLQITRCQAKCGNILNSLEVTKNNYDALNENITLLMSNLEDADMTELMTKYQMQKISLEASYALAAKIGNISIVDFIR